MATIFEGKKKDGTKYFYTRVTIGKLPSGSPRQKYLEGPTRKDVEARARALEVDHDRGKVIPARMSVQGLCAEWLTHAAASDLEASTLRGYRYFVEKTIVPGFGYMAIESLRPYDLQRWLDGIARPSMREHSWRIFNTCLKWAFKMELLDKNPMDNVTLKGTKSEKQPRWNREEMARFLPVARHSVYWPIWYLFLVFPARVGELRGLKWDNVDLDRGIIHVVESLSGYMDKSYPKLPKSDAGVRDIPLTADDVQVLSEHAAYQSELQRRLGPSWENTDLVCTGIRGQAIHPKFLRRECHRLAGLAGIRSLPPQPLRHTCIDLLIESGIDPGTVAALAGHHDASLTLAVYAMPGMKQKRKGVDALASLRALADDQGSFDAQTGVS
jgi:integrase